MDSEQNSGVHISGPIAKWAENMFLVKVLFFVYFSLGDVSCWR